MSLRSHSKIIERKQYFLLVSIQYLYEFNLHVIVKT